MDANGVLGSVFDRDNNALRVSGSGLIPAYTSFAPTLTSSGGDLVLGSDATTTGYYGQVGKRVFGYGSIMVGTAANGLVVGTGSYGVLLPVEPVNRTQPVGTGYIADASDSSGRVVLTAMAILPSIFASSTMKAVLITNNAAGEGFGNSKNPAAAAAPPR